MLVYAMVNVNFPDCIIINYFIERICTLCVVTLKLYFFKHKLIIQREDGNSLRISTNEFIQTAISNTFPISISLLCTNLLYLVVYILVFGVF